MRIVQLGWSRLRHSPRWAQAAVAVVVAVALLGAAGGGDGDREVTAGTATTSTPETTTTAEATTTTTEPPTTTTDGVARDDVADEDLALLESLVVAAEQQAGTYDRSLFPHWDDADRDGCDTRCEVLTSQQLGDGGWFSEWDGATEHDSSLVHVDHVVALAEAWRSGAHTWSPGERDDFADDRTNLLAVTASANLRKSDKDAAAWFPSRYQANCLWARTVVVVKSKWSLSVDPAERDALANLLTSCGAVPPTTTTAAPQPPPPPAEAPVASGGGAGDCTPGYDPCLPRAEDYDCAGGSGNGPAYTGRVTVDHAHGDPYDLDRDRDGVACAG